MTKRTHGLTRRQFSILSGAAALMPSSVAAQSFVDFERFAARCRALSGFDPLPRNLLVALAGVMEPLEKRALIDGGALAEDLRLRVLNALYTGVYEPAGNGDLQRIGYQDALMFAAIEDSLNVPSYCGGLPGYWAEKPQLG